MRCLSYHAFTWPVFAHVACSRSLTHKEWFICQCKTHLFNTSLHNLNILIMDSICSLSSTPARFYLIAKNLNGGEEASLSKVLFVFFKGLECGGKQPLIKTSPLYTTSVKYSLVIVWILDESCSVFSGSHVMYVHGKIASTRCTCGVFSGSRIYYIWCCFLPPFHYYNAIFFLESQSVVMHSFCNIIHLVIISMAQLQISAWVAAQSTILFN